MASSIRLSFGCRGSLDGHAGYRQENAMADTTDRGSAQRSAQGPAAESDLKLKLRDEFGDGKIPTGANFGELIDAFALESELAGVEGRVEKLEHPENGEFSESVSIGSVYWVSSQYWPSA